ncbi:hypothetical protein VHEMI01783 [[Torrubiella] hemipterigena]|uniref:Ribosome maturation protein SDO1/SBDS N-terminal domain-containing protein n=1 Tax=[Torrubiella] hemipterigena TaxID=1531966 RepID=A0A0A1T6E0_9HYPO|nr:hypothetical protein VHEMI01783 [[Torrubiella] hemipterigena]
MTRGEAVQTKVHYKGKNEDYVVFVDDADTYKKWQSDKSIPMAHFVSTFQVFTTHKHGAQGNLDTAPKNILSAEFDTENQDDIIKIILEKGTSQTVEMPDRQGSKNDSMSSMNAK